MNNYSILIVALYMSAWIEIFIYVDPVARTGRRTLHECVD